jgi:two-component system NarL family response regulator
MTSPTLRILLVDDHQIFREALRSLLERVPELSVVGDGDGGDVLRLVQELAPDIVCLDIAMPGLSGIDALRQLRAAGSKVKVIVLTSYTDQAFVLDIMKAGAAGYVAKSEGGRELLRAIDAVKNGHEYVSPGVGDLQTRATLSQQHLPERSLLAPREREVLRQVAQGKSSQDIAGELGIALGTVEVHRRNIMHKLDLHNVVDLTRYALRCGLVAE